MSGGAKGCAALWSAASQKPGARKEQGQAMVYTGEAGQARAAPAEYFTEAAGPGARLD